MEERAKYIKNVRGGLKLVLGQIQSCDQDNTVFKIIKDDELIKEEDIYYINCDFYKYYKETSILGEGCVGLVKKCIRNSDQQVFAVKIVKTRDEETTFNIKREFQNIKKLSHPNIVKVYELYIDFQKSKIYTIMEYVEASEMFSVIHDLGHYSEEVAKIIFKQILEGISYMHQNGICHRDIKPNNILANSDGSQVKITDFNISKFSEDYKKFDNKDQIKMWTYTGTIAFSAPEIFGESSYTQQVDIWSAGVVLYTMLSGQQPFNAEYVDDLIKLIQACYVDMSADIWTSVSQEAKDLILLCMNKVPEQRLTPDKALEHPWIVNKIDANRRFTMHFIDNILKNRKSIIKQEIFGYSSEVLTSNQSKLRSKSILRPMFGKQNPFSQIKYSVQEFNDSTQKLFNSAIYDRFHSQEKMRTSQLKSKLNEIKDNQNQIVKKKFQIVQNYSDNSQQISEFNLDNQRQENQDQSFSNAINTISNSINTIEGIDEYDDDEEYQQFAQDVKKKTNLKF